MVASLCAGVATVLRSRAVFATPFLRVAVASPQRWKANKTPRQTQWHPPRTKEEAFPEELREHRLPPTGEPLTPQPYDFLGGKVEDNFVNKKDKRVGLVARKVGMLSEWTPWGDKVALTVLEVQDNQAVRVMLKETDGSTAVEVGGFNMQRAQFATMKKAALGHFMKYGVHPKRKRTWFPVTDIGLMLPGTPMTCAHFVPGQYVDVRARTKGKGFQGVMKRWGFKGHPASHGTSKSHRGKGAMGGGNRPARVFPGSKMAGHMGDDMKINRNMFVYKINTKFNLIFVRGAIHGPKGAFVTVRDAMLRDHPHPPPVPTYEGDLASLPEEIYAFHPHRNMPPVF